MIASKKNSILQQGYIYVPYIISTDTTVITGDFSPKKSLIGRYFKANRRKSRKIKIENIFENKTLLY
jgi:hypothetical protein